MAKDKAAIPLERMRAICLALPEARETLTWGKPHVRVRDKIFAGFGEEEGRPTIGFKLAPDHAAARVASDPRCSKAPYVGHKGWVQMEVGRGTDWAEVAELVRESYRLIAPKRLAAQLDAVQVSPAPAERTPPAG